jgi:uncharacterized protein (TIGR02271 family)
MTAFDVTSLIGTTVLDPSGDPIGTVAQVYLDDGTGRPQWVTVRTDVAGPRETFVPLAAARIDAGRLVVDATREQVSGAPAVRADGHISSVEEAGIYRYYGFGDDAMTRSEEHLVAGTRTVDTERVRLRKYVVTEMATVQVPVRREEVRLEHEPIPDAEREAAYAGGSVTDSTGTTDATEAERDMILHAERPVVTTETVAVERVRLGKETVAGTETVTGQVRREEIELEN